MAVAKTKDADQIAEERSPAAAVTHAGPIAEFTKEEEFQALRQMLLIRRFEEKAGQMYILRTYHLSGYRLWLASLVERLGR